MAACPASGVLRRLPPLAGCLRQGQRERELLCRQRVCVQVKLAMRSVPMPGDAPSVPKPILTITCRGPNLNMVQDLPISKPHLPARAPPARTLSHITVLSSVRHQARRLLSYSLECSA